MYRIDFLSLTRGGELEVIKYFRQFFRDIRRWWGGGKTIEHYQELYFLQAFAPDFQQIQSYKLESPADWCLKGEELIQSSQYKKASICFEQALKIAPRHADALSGKGFCF